MIWPFSGRDSQQIKGGTGNTQNIGVDPELFVAELRRKDDAITALIAEKDLLRQTIHQGDLARLSLENEITNLREEHQRLQSLLANPQKAYAEHKQRESQIEQLLSDSATLQGIGENRIAAALNDFKSLKYDELDAIFAETEERGLLIAANAAFGRGLLAEDAVQWHDAARHYARAADLNPTFDTLYKARAFALRQGDYAAALRFGEDLLDWVNTHGTQEQLAAAINAHAVTLDAQGDHGKAEAMLRQALEIAAATIGTTHADYGAGLNNLANSLQAQGHYADAEQLFRQALKICADMIGKTQPDYAVYLNNLAGVVRALGRCTEAEELYRQALEIGAATIGIEHPDYATHLNNLAGVVKAQGRYAEAEGLYRQALEIDVATIGTFHPEYATHLNNLAGAVQRQGRYEEAEALYRQALAVHAATFGMAHSECARDIHNLAHVVRVQGRFAEASQLYGQALAICAQTLGGNHPHTQLAIENLLSLLLTHFPDDPEIPALQALLAPTP